MDKKRATKKSRKLTPLQEVSKKIRDLITGTDWKLEENASRLLLTLIVNGLERPVKKLIIIKSDLSQELYFEYSRSHLGLPPVLHDLNGIKNESVEELASTLKYMQSLSICQGFKKQMLLRPKCSKRDQAFGCLRDQRCMMVFSGIYGNTMCYFCDDMWSSYTRKTELYLKKREEIKKYFVKVARKLHARKLRLLQQNILTNN